MELDGALTENLRIEPRKRRERNAWRFASLVTVIPSLLWLSLVCLCGVPVLFGDEWAFVPFIVKLRTGTLSLQDFWIAYGEHRLTLSRLCFALFFGHGFVDPFPVMLCSWILATVTTIVGVRYLVWPAIKDFDTLSKVLAGFSFSAWALSLVQFENQLWGLQIGFVGTFCCVILGGAILAAEALPFGWRIVGLIFTAALATFTSGQAVLVWPAFAVGLAMAVRRGLTCVFVVIPFVIGLAGALWLYKVDGSGLLSRSEAFGWVLSQPGLALQSILGLLGSPLTYAAGSSRLQLATWAGLTLLVAFLLLLVFAFVRKHPREAAPLVILGFYGCAYAVLVTLGRARNGYNDWFLTSRYTTSALTLTLAVTGLGLRELQNRAGGRAALARHVTLTAVFGLALANSVAGFRLAKKEAILRSASMRLLDYADIFDSRVDGMPTGPFYALCPIDGSRLLDWGISPARRAGLIPGLRQIVPEGTAQGSWHRETGHRQVWYLAHNYRVERLSGILEAVRGGFHPDIVLIRAANERHFSAFGLLDRDHWQIDLSLAMAKHLPDPVEIFALETATGRLVQLTR
jgi:hypothetical protein